MVPLRSTDIGDRDRCILIDASHRSVCDIDLYERFTAPWRITTQFISRRKCTAGDTQWREMMFFGVASRAGDNGGGRRSSRVTTTQQQSRLSRPQSWRTMPRENRLIHARARTAYTCRMCNGVECFRRVGTDGNI